MSANRRGSSGSSSRRALISHRDSRGDGPSILSFSARATRQQRGRSFHSFILRKSYGAPVEATSPKLVETTSTLVQHPVIRPGTPIRPRWSGDLAQLVEVVADNMGITVDALQSRSKRPEIVTARRVAIIAAYEILGRSMADITAVVGIAGSTGCNLLRRSPERVVQARETAMRVAKQCRELAESERTPD